MKTPLIFLMSIVIAARGYYVSEDCKYGKKDPNGCCERPQGKSDGSAIFLANPEDCAKYYMCIGKAAFKTSCKSGEIWDVSKEKCKESSSTDKCKQKQKK